MNIRTLLAAAALVAAQTAAVSGPPAEQVNAIDAAVEHTPGLVAYFPFNYDTATNSAVGGYSLTLMNGADIAGPGSGPMRGDRTSFSVILDNHGSCHQYLAKIDPRPLRGHVGSRGSVAAWIKLASLPRAEGRIFSIAGESTAGDDLDLQIDNGDNTLRFYTDSGGYAAAPAFTAASVGKWIFVAATFSAGGERAVYVNGVKAGASAAGPHRPSPNADFYIGQSNVFQNRCFNGAVADVALFDVPLAPAQIAALYHAAGR